MTEIAETPRVETARDKTRPAARERVHGADGGAAGYRAHGTLTFATEFRRQLTRGRTQWTLVLMAVLPVVLYLAFALGGDSQAESDPAEIAAGVDLSDLATGSAANFVVFMLMVSSSFLLILVAALFCGDTVAGESSWGSLRYLLATPVPRGRLLSVKFSVGLVYTVLALAILVASGLLVGGLAYGWGPLTAPLGGEVPASEAIWRVLGAAGYSLVTLLVVASFGLLLSVSTSAPLAAVGGAVLLPILSNILNAVNELGDLRMVLPTRFNQAWLGLLSSPMQFDEMTKGAVMSLGYAAVFTVCAFWRFSRIDITS